MFVKCRIQNCTTELPSGVKDSLQYRGVRWAEEELTQVHTGTHKHRHSQRYTHAHTDTNAQTHWHKHTHTRITTGIYTHRYRHTSTHGRMHTNTNMHTQPFMQHSDTHAHAHTTHTHTQTPCQHTLIITQQNSLRQCPNCATVFNVDWLQEQQEVLKVKYWLRVGKQANRPSEKDLNLLHTNHSVSGATTGYLLFNNNTFPGTLAVARCWTLLTSRYWQDEEDMELCSD